VVAPADDQEDDAEWESARETLLGHLAKGHRRFHDSRIFRGPSLHFHTRALAAAKASDFEHFAEMAYALLVSWGMHRMGPGGAKMLPFDEFHRSLTSVRPVIEPLLARPASGPLPEGEWAQLRRAFLDIRAMESTACLVANSKVLAHWLPEIVAPIDRRYTLRFLARKHPPTQSREGQADLFCRIQREFFHRVVDDGRFRAFESDLKESAARSWNSSSLKLADNVMIGLMLPDPELGADA
jgi:hypothetical protein